VTFVERGLGDVLLAWENEALLVVNRLKPGQFEIVVPSLSILAEPPVAVVDQVADRRGTREVAVAYLEYLYAPVGQEIAARHYYRPHLKSVAAKYAGQYPDVERFSIDDAFGGWDAAQRKHFAEGGVFDQIFVRR
jgi:sulfate transport system substrate-binding protein